MSRKVDECKPLVRGKSVSLGYHATEEAAAQAVDEYKVDHAAGDDAAAERVGITILNNVNVLPLASNADGGGSNINAPASAAASAPAAAAGTKRAALTPPAPQKTKTMRLDTSAGAAGAGQGLTLVHFSARPEPFLTHNKP